MYEYCFPDGETIEIRAIPRDGYRLIATLPTLPDPPEPALWTMSDSFGRYREEPEWEDPWFLRLEKFYDAYATNKAALQQYIASRWVIIKGVIGGPISPLSIHPDELMECPKMEWVFDKCSSNDVYYDLLDAIIGINMPTESGVRSVLNSFQSMILDHGEIIPLLDWKSRKERKGGMMMNLYAEGLLACKELAGSISFKEYFDLVGDPRYIDDSSPFPFSMSHVVAVIRHSNLSSNAVQEIEMEKEEKEKKKNPDGTDFDPFWDID